MDSQAKSAPTRRPPSFASPRGFKGFLHEVQTEAKKVVWPTPYETTRLTGVVATVCLIVVVLLLGLGFVADQLISIVIGKGS